MKFSNIKEIKDNLLKSLKEIDFIEMSPIQEKTIPLAIEGFDIIGQAQTGTGKTAAFGIPILNMVNPESKYIEHLVIAPTRELAKQIYEQFLKYGKYINELRISLIVGGVSYDKQIKDIIQKPNIIIGTPGRINDFLLSKKINLSNIKTFTLDEADELLNMGFKDEIESIISYLNENKQSFFFTATFNEKVKKMAKLILKSNHKNVSISSGLNTSNNIKQEYVLLKEKTKFIILIKLLRYYKPKSVVIFCRTKKRVDELTDALKKIGINVIGLHGDIQQKNRSQIMSQFRNNKKQILVATDVVARGIDIEHIEWIINFDLPQEIENYTHRIGRVGRNGTQGYSLSFVKNDEIEHLKEIEIKTNSKIKETFEPNDNELYKKWREDVKNKFNKILDVEYIDEPRYLEEELLNEYSHQQMAMIIAHYLLIENQKYKKIVLSPEPSVVLKGQAKIRNIKNRINKFSNNKKGLKKYDPKRNKR